MDKEVIDTHSQKDTAISFLHNAASGTIKKAYRAYVHTDFTHHNAYFPEDRESLMEGMIDNAKQFPDKQFDVKHVYEDHDTVIVHSHLRLKKGDPGHSTIHILKFENGYIIEMWDIVQQIPDTSPNKSGPF